ncbi:MAG TPA: hypothetical protein DCF33_05615, partial [Saprospirales bacterium]|nr:hypothetical protein [Saprospirales bacterium]
MTPFTPAIISEVADQLDCGFRVFVHKKTGNIVSLPNEIDMMDADPELWQEEIDMVENNLSDYFEIEKWTSGDAFRVMLEFAEQCVAYKPLKIRLLDALEQR